MGIASEAYVATLERKYKNALEREAELIAEIAYLKSQSDLITESRDNWRRVVESYERTPPHTDAQP